MARRIQHHVYNTDNQRYQALARRLQHALDLARTTKQLMAEAVAIGNGIEERPMTVEQHPKMVSFTRAKLRALKKEYLKHADSPEATFTLDGDEYLVGYAKYLIEYLETQLGKV